MVYLMARSFQLSWESKILKNVKYSVNNMVVT